MAHPAEKEKRFASLISQAEIPDSFVKRYFTGGMIEKLEVFQREKKWVLHISLDELLPCDVFKAFIQRINQTFEHVQTVDCHFRYRKLPDIEKVVAEYWTFVVEQVHQRHGSLNGSFSSMQSCIPRTQDKDIIVPVPHDITRDMLQKKGADQHLSTLFEQLTGLRVRIVFEAEDSDTAYEEFHQQRMEEERALIEKAAREAAEARKKEKESENEKDDRPVMIGYEIQDEVVSVREITEEEKRVAVRGQIFDVTLRELKSGRTLVTFNITDFDDSIMVKIFSRDKDDIPQFQRLSDGMWVKVRGSVQHDQFVRELVLIANDINQITPETRADLAEDKRVELHLHTPMSAMDAVSSVKDLVGQAAKWGHPAVAITDHGVVQSFPEAFAAGNKAGIKIIYGMEAYIVDDGVPLVHNPQPRSIKDDTYVVFDVETTGLSSYYDTIIELAAVKVKGGEIIDTFESFVNPHQKLTDTIIELTGITDDMVKDAPELDQVLTDFRDFVGDAVLAAHNARFDMGFLNMGYKKIGQPQMKNPVIDTLELARYLYPDLKNFRLNTLCKKFNIELVSHHRAVYDAQATGYLLWKMLIDCTQKGMESLDQLNDHTGEGDYARQRPFHVTILVQNKTGLKNLYKLVSYSHVRYFHRVPRIPRSLLVQHREGLLIGSSCEKGEFYEAVMQKSPEEAETVAQFYDYLEIQPLTFYEHLVEKELVKSRESLLEIHRRIVDIGDKLRIPVVATGNVHHLEPHDKTYRKILIASQGGANPLDPEKLPDAYFRTTDEMLAEFSFLGEERSREVVIDNSRRIAEMIEEIKPIPDDLYTPNIEGADREIREMSYQRAKELYGDPLPEIVEARLEKELDSIIGHGFAVIYLISHKLVAKSLEDGYLVGSRGSVGSSFVATMTGITEVNPLPPHYVCPACKHSQFFDDGSVASGYDLPDRDCPHCEAKMIKDGQDIPFETFLGFKGDKVPDIDLNFSGEYQPIAHKYTQELFGVDNVYRAGTIGTVAEKTAFGFVKKYQEEAGKQFRNAEVSRLAQGCTGVKRTTGQHPGGIIVVPDYMEIYDFCPIQYPADDRNSEWRTTHFDFHSIHDNLLKLDILGHDDPTVIRMLQDLTGINPREIPPNDPEVMKIFSGTEVLGVTAEQIGTNTGTLGIPEFGTKFVRQMLEDTLPTTFAELVQISGLSHGTDVWLNNAQELVRKGTCELKDVIGCRDDIMVYLMHKGLEPSFAFKIMESVRKGRGLTEEMEEEMKKHDVPDWYIWSCKQIKYMFPKAHAAAYVLMAVRIAWFKVNRPIEFYATYFTVRADDFDVSLAVKGSNAIRNKIREIEEKGNDASPKEKSLLTVLELCLEMCERGFHFKNVDLYRSDATQFIIDGDGLIPPFNALPGVGTNAALNIVNAREEGEFLSKEDLQQRSRISKSVVEYLEQQDCLKDLPDSNQLSLF